MKTKLILLSTYCCFLLFSTQLNSQILKSSPDFTKEAIRDSIEITLEEYNRILIKSGFNTLSVNDAFVTPRNTIWLTYELPTPEEGEDEDAGQLGVGLAPRSILESPVFAPSYSLGTSIDGLDFDDNATLAGSYYIPPDPSGAVGTTHVGHVVNTSISFHTKAGAVASGFPQSLANFFSSLSPATNTFDPKILWDQYENRWVVVTLEKTDTPTNISKIFLAVSATANPSGTWHFQTLDVLDGTCWFDYPGLAVDDKAIYLTGNYFEFSGGSCNSQVVIVDKGVSGGIYDGMTSTFNRYNQVVEAGAGFDVTNMPAHTFGTRTATEGTYLIGYSGISGGGIESVQVFTITNPLATPPTFTQNFISLGDIDDTATSFPDAPQLGSATDIEANDRRALHAVWRDGKLWTVSQIIGSGANAGQSSVIWAKLNATTAGGLSLDATGLIDGEDISTGAYTWMPCIAVNSSGDAAVGFSASSSTIYAGAYASIIDGMTNTSGASMTIKAGTDDYVRTFGGDNRWGDYSGTALDPVNENFWIINGAAITNGTDLGDGEVGRWQVFIQELVAGTSCLTDLNITATPVVTDTYEASNSLTTNSGSTIEVNSGSTVTFKAGNFVQLNIGFHSKSGSDFKAEIGACSAAMPFVSNYDDERFSPTHRADLEIAKSEPFSLAMTVYPNPSSGETTIEYKLPTDSEVFIGLYNQSGQEMDILMNQQNQSKGQHQLKFDTINLPDGFYLISIRTNNELKHEKILVSSAK